ncbi:MAG: hypothetical protein IJB88_05820, partial [Clostridia bacterium]|nr:hypothetical protein [Clostridia bacterium]
MQLARGHAQQAAHVLGLGRRQMDRGRG